MLFYVYISEPFRCVSEPAMPCVRELENDIEHGRLSPGDRLDEQTLAERFEVSRTPAREALLQLAAAGIVRLVPRQGAVVSSVSPQLAIGMVEVLTALEAEAAGLAARRMSSAEKAQLAKLHLASQAAVKRLDSPAYIKNNAAFHAAIYQGIAQRIPGRADQGRRGCGCASIIAPASISRPG